MNRHGGMTMYLFLLKTNPILAIKYLRAMEAGGTVMVAMKPEPTTFSLN